MTTQFTISKPDDMHVHFRQGKMLKVVVPHTAKQFARAVIMPNTSTPITSLKQLRAYKQEILEAIPTGTLFQPLMTMYLSKDITKEDLEMGKKSRDLHAVKMYPFGVTTNSEHGIQNIEEAAEVLKNMEALGIPLLIHGEDSNPQTDVFDREKVFYETILPDILKIYPNLKITCEHITTKIAADFIASSPENIGATITPHHLLVDRNAMLGNGINPHLYCKPILKRKEDHQALLDLLMTGHSRVFAGTDSAPHTTNNKENSCGCAGVYSACNAIELYAQAFDQAGDLSKPETQKLFENFMSKNGAAFYGLSQNKETIPLLNKSTTVPKIFEIETGETLTPWMSGKEIQWAIV